MVVSDYSLQESAILWVHSALPSGSVKTRSGVAREVRPFHSFQRGRQGNPAGGHEAAEPVEQIGSSPWKAGGGDFELRMLPSTGEGWIVGKGRRSICSTKEDVMEKLTVPPGFQDMRAFSLLEALLGRRSRRFFMGAEIPDGFFAFKSRHEPVPLSDLEKLLVVMACGGNTSWHHMIYRAQRYAPNLSNYAGAASGRTFPSGAGFHTSMTFFTDDEGVYVLDARDAPAFSERDSDGSLDIGVLLEVLRKHVRKLYEGRLRLPPEVPIHGGSQYLGGQSSGNLAGHPCGGSGATRPFELVLHAAKRDRDQRRHPWPIRPGD